MGTIENREEPDLAKCRTRPVAAAWPKQRPLFSQCLAENEECRYARELAYEFFCRHPRHLDFREQEESEG